MDTSNSFDFCLNDLPAKKEPEEQELQDLCISLIGVILADLKPILRYIVKPTTTASGQVRLVMICEKGADVLFLGENGELIAFEKRADRLYQMSGGFHWFGFNVGDMLEGLRIALQEAQSCRETHLNAIRVRNEKIKKVLVDLGFKHNFKKE